MDIEIEGVNRHPWHLGTDRKIAETFVREQLCKRGVKSVALRCDDKLVRIYDWRDL